MMDIVNLLTIHHLMSITEISLKEDKLFHVNAINCANYIFIGTNRHERCGVGVFLPRSMKLKVQLEYNY